MRLNILRSCRAALSLLVAAGCGNGPQLKSAVTVRDSAGIEIVSSASPTTNDHSTVSAKPLLQIGVIDENEQQAFFRVRDIAAHAERYLVVNGGSDEVRIFGKDGAYLGALGGSGDGPGEFRSPAAVFVRASGEIEVVDLHKVSVFASDGSFIRSYAFGRHPLGRAGDGSYVTLGFAAGVDPSQLGQGRDSLALIRVWPIQPSLRDTLVILPGPLRFRIIRGHGIASQDVAFGPAPLVAVDSSFIYVAAEAAYAINAYDLDGRLIRVIRREIRRRPVTAEMRSSYERSRLEAVSASNRSWLESVFREWTYPEEYPALDRLVVDENGRLWARGYVTPGELQSNWDIFDRSGAWITSLRLPSGLEVFQITADEILGVNKDAADIEYVQVYGLQQAPKR